MFSVGPTTVTVPPVIVIDPLMSIPSPSASTVMSPPVITSALPFSPSSLVVTPTVPPSMVTVAASRPS